MRAARAAAGADVAIMVDTNCPWTPEQARHMTLKLRAVRSLLAGGADLPARGFHRDRQAACGHGRCHGGRREHLHVLPVPRHARGRRRRLRPAQRHQGGRHHGVPEGGDALRRRGRHPDAALALFRAGLPRDPASSGRARHARRHDRALPHGSGGKPLRRAHHARGRQLRAADRPGTGSRSRSRRVKTYGA